MLNVKTSKTKGSYTDIPFPLDSLARNISRGVYTGPSVTLVPVIIILVSRYVNSTLFIRYHGFSWQTSLWAFSQSLLYINDINQNGIYQKIPKSIRHVILRAFLQVILRSAIEVLRNRNGSPTRKHQASWFPMEKKKIWKLWWGIILDLSELKGPRVEQYAQWLHWVKAFAMQPGNLTSFLITHSQRREEVPQCCPLASTGLVWSTHNWMHPIHTIIMYDLKTTTQTEDPKEKPSWDCKGMSD